MGRDWDQLARMPNTSIRLAGGTIWFRPIHLSIRRSLLPAASPAPPAARRDVGDRDQPRARPLRSDQRCWRKCAAATVSVSFTGCGGSASWPAVGHFHRRRPWQSDGRTDLRRRCRGVDQSGDGGLPEQWQAGVGLRELSGGDRRRATKCEQIAACVTSNQSGPCRKVRVNFPRLDGYPRHLVIEYHVLATERSGNWGKSRAEVIAVACRSLSSPLIHLAPPPTTPAVARWPEQREMSPIGRSAGVLSPGPHRRAQAVQEDARTPSVAMSGDAAR